MRNVSVSVLQMPVGLLYGMSKTSVRITATAGQVLDILIENMGRVGYGRAMNSMTKVSEHRPGLSVELPCLVYTYTCS